VSDLRDIKECRPHVAELVQYARDAAAFKGPGIVPRDANGLRVTAKAAAKHLRRVHAEGLVNRLPAECLAVIARGLKRAERYEAIEAARYAREDAEKKAAVEADRARIAERFENDPAFRAAVFRERR
jgi:hypothetical protein